MNTASNPNSQVRALFGLFSTNLADDLPEFEFVAADEVPAPYRELLVHEHHMTVTVEKFHGDTVDVKVLGAQHQGESYARKILLALHGNGRVVQFGIMRIDFRHCGPDVKKEILGGSAPLGRILIQHDILRRIEPTAYLRVLPGPAMMNWFGLKTPKRTYGRLAYIHCNNQPAVELLEIVAPEG